MANQTYIVQLPSLSAQVRHVAYAKLSLLCTHIENLGVDLLSVVVDPAALTITVTLTGPLPVEQLDHLGLV